MAYIVLVYCAYYLYNNIELIPINHLATDPRLNREQTSWEILLEFMN